VIKLWFQTRQPHGFYVLKYLLIVKRQEHVTNCTTNFYNKALLFVLSMSVFKVFTIGLHACLLAFCELLVITATCPLVSGHSLSLAICTSLAFDRWSSGIKHGDKFVAQYLISIVCAGIRTNYCIGLSGYIAITNLSITAVFVEYRRQFL